MREVVLWLTALPLAFVVMLWLMGTLSSPRGASLRVLTLCLCIALVFVAYQLVPTVTPQKRNRFAKRRHRWLLQPIACWALGMQPHEIRCADAGLGLRHHFALVLLERPYIRNLVGLFICLYGAVPQALVVVLALRVQQQVLSGGLLAVLAALFMLLLYRFIMRPLFAPELRARLREAGCNTCVRCGYDLSGHGETNVICPECGLRHPEPPGEAIRGAPWTSTTGEEASDLDDSKRSPSGRG